MYTGYWIKDGWLYHLDGTKSAKVWIFDNRFWRLGGDTNTGHWLSGQHIYGPTGYTGYWMADGYGPNQDMPFSVT